MPSYAHGLCTAAYAIIRSWYANVHIVCLQFRLMESSFPVNRYVSKSDSIEISVWNQRKTNKKKGGGFLGCIKIMSNMIGRLKDTGPQRLDLCRQDSDENNADPIRGGFQCFVITAISCSSFERFYLNPHAGCYNIIRAHVPLEILHTGRWSSVFFSTFGLHACLLFGFGLTPGIHHLPNFNADPPVLLLGFQIRTSLLYVISLYFVSLSTNSIRFVRFSAGQIVISIASRDHEDRITSNSVVDARSLATRTSNLTPNDVPDGWEVRPTASGRVQYVNHYTR